MLGGAVSKGIQNLKTLELKWNDIEKDDENLEDISLSLKQRGGKILASEEEGEGEREEGARRRLPRWTRRR